MAAAVKRHGCRAQQHESCPEAQRIGTAGSSSPRQRIAALSPCSEDGSCRRSSLHFLLRLALLAWMNDSLVQRAYPLGLLPTGLPSLGSSVVETALCLAERTRPSRRIGGGLAGEYRVDEVRSRLGKGPAQGFH